MFPPLFQLPEHLWLVVSCNICGQETIKYRISGWTVKAYVRTVSFKLKCYPNESFESQNLSFTFSLVLYSHSESLFCQYWYKDHMNRTIRGKSGESRSLSQHSIYCITSNWWFWGLRWKGGEDNLIIKVDNGNCSKKVTRSIKSFRDLGSIVFYI